MSISFKTRKRLSRVFANTTHHFIPIVFQALFSFYIIRQFSSELWGEYVKIAVWIQLILQFLNWGMKDFLLRSFSENPAGHIFRWRDALKARSVLFLPVILGLIYLFPKLSFILLLWILGSFLNRSYDVLYIFNNTFKVLMVRDIIIYSASFSVFILIASVDLENIIIFLALISLLQTLFNLFWFKKDKSVRIPICIVYDKANLAASLPFFLIALSGLLQSRTDIYMITLLLDKNSLASYQVYSNFILLWIALVYMLLVPFIKNLYRLKSNSVKNLQRKFVIFNTLASVFFLSVLAVLLSRLYGFQFSGYFWIMALLSLVPVFYNNIETHLIYRINKEKVIVAASFVAAFCSGLINYFLLPVYGMEAAVSISAASNISLMLFYKTYMHNYSKT